MAKIQGLATSSPLHIINGSTGGTAHSTGDVLVVEGLGSAGITILCETGFNAALLFGDGAGQRDGRILYAHANNSMVFSTADIAGFEIDGNQNIILGAAPTATTAAGNLHIPIDTSPTAAIVGGIVIGSKDASAGATDATLELWLETAPIAVGTFTASHKFPIWINGAEYHLELDAV